MDTAVLEKSIYSSLPAIPFLIDQVEVALKWAKEALDESEYRKALKVALNVTEYVGRTSEANFFKIHLVTASILSNIPNALEDERFKTFETASRAVETALKRLKVDERVTEEAGCFKALILHLVPLASEDQDCLVIMSFLVRLLLSLLRY